MRGETESGNHSPVEPDIHMKLPETSRPGGPALILRPFVQQIYLPSSKAGSFFYLFARWCSLKMCSLEEVCVFPFYLCASDLLGTLWPKPGAGISLAAMWSAGSQSSWDFILSSLGAAPALRVVCVHTSWNHVSVNVCRSGAQLSSQPCIYEGPPTFPPRRALRWRSRYHEAPSPKEFDRLKGRDTDRFKSTSTNLPIFF